MPIADTSDRLLTSVRQPVILEANLETITVSFKTGPNVPGTQFTIKCVFKDEKCNSPAQGQSVIGYLPIKPSAVEGTVQGLDRDQTYSCYVKTSLSGDGEVSYCQEATPLSMPAPPPSDSTQEPTSESEPEPEPLALFVTAAGNQTAGIAGSVSQCSLTSTGLIGQCTEIFSNTSVVPLSSNTFILPSQETRAGAGSVATLVSYCEELEGGVAAVKDNGPLIPQKSMDSGIIFSSDVLVPPTSVAGAFRSTNYTGPNVFLSTLYSGIQGCLLDVESLEIQDCIDIISDPQILYPMVSVNTLSLRAYLPDANQTVLGCNVNATTGAFDQCSAMSEKFDIPTAIAFTNNQTIAYIVSSNATFDLFNGTPTIEGPGYVTVCQVDAIGEFENCKVAIAGLSAPTSVSFFENLAFISQSGTDTITTCNVSEEDGTFDDCKDSATKFTNPSSVEVVVRG